MKKLKSKTINGFLYKAIEVFGVKGGQLVVSIILARILVPEEFGVIALVSVFIHICNSFVSLGFPSALIQKSYTTPNEESSVFYFNIGLSVALYSLIFFTSLSIESVYQIEGLALVLRVTSIVLIINALSHIQFSLLTKMLNFKPIMIVNVASLIASGSIGVYMAYAGFGIWALVTQQIVNSLIKAITIWFIYEWRPLLKFDKKCIAELAPFGSKMMLTSLVSSLFNGMYVFVIGKTYPTAELAFYTRSKQLPFLVMDSISGIVSSVMFPALSLVKTDKTRLKAILRKVIQVTYLIICPTLVGLAAVAEPLIRLLLTEKWLPIVPYMQLLTVVFIFLPFQALSSEVLKSLGKADAFFKIELIKKFLLLLTLLLTYEYGIIVMILGQILHSIVCLIIMGIYINKLIRYNLVEQISDFALSLVNSIIMGCIVYVILSYSLNYSDFVKVSLGIFLGVSLYSLLNIITKNKSFYLLLSFSKQEL